MATTSLITGRVPLPSDDPISYAELTFTLSGLDSEGSDVFLPGISKRVVLVDSEIPAGFDLWRNTEGYRGTNYKLLARWVEVTRDGKRDRYAELPAIQIGDDAEYEFASLLMHAPFPAPSNSYWSSITQEEYNAAIEAAAQAQAFGAAYDKTDAEMLTITIPAPVKLIHRFPLTASVGQVAPVLKLTTWYRWTGSTEGKTWFADASGAVFILVGLTEELLLSVVGSAINGLATDPVYGVAPFASLAAFNAADIPASITRVEVLSAVVPSTAMRTIAFARQTGAAFTGLRAGWVPDGDVYADHFAQNVTQGTTDMAGAINAACTYVASLGGGVVNLTPGRYRTASTVYIPGRGVTIEGQGSGGRGTPSTFFVGSKILGDHNNGPVIHFEGEEFHLRNVTIDATSARNLGGKSAATYGRNNFGILVEPPDTAGSVFLGDFSIENVHVLNQPGSGAVFAGPCRRGVMDQLYTRYNLGHGIVITNGPFVSRVNTPTGGNGILDFRGCTSEVNGGYGVFLGDPAFTTTRVFRTAFRLLECSDNGSDAALRVSGEVSQVWVRGDEIDFVTCAFRGRLPAAAFSGGIYAEGRGHIYTNNRFVDTIYSVKIGDGGSAGYYGRQFVIDSIRVFDDTIGTPQAVAIITSATTSGVYVTATNTGNITSLIDSNAIGVFVNYVGSSGSLTTTARGDMSVTGKLIAPNPILGQTLVIDDDTYVDLTYTQDINSSVMTVSVNSSTAPSGSVWVRARSTPGIAVIAATNSTSLEVSTTALDATTATDAKLTICALSTRVIRIVNRLGGQRRVSVAFNSVDFT